jgi:hypothetical protein
LVKERLNKKKDPKRIPGPIRRKQAKCVNKKNPKINKQSGGRVGKQKNPK